MRTSFLSPALYNKLYAVMQYENALALRVSLETGWRIDDVLHLTTAQLNGRTLECVAMKTGKYSRKVISADLAKRLRQVANNGRLFDGRFGDKPRTRQAVWKDIKKAAKQLELDGNIAPHSARKTYAVERFHDGGLGEVQRELQHDNVSTAMIYAFADLIDKKPALAQRLTDGQPAAPDKMQPAHCADPDKVPRTEWAALEAALHAAVSDCLRNFLKSGVDFGNDV